MNVILILHGWGSCSKNWEKVKKLLESRGCKVFLPDLPGFGKNPLPEKSWSLDDYREWLKEFCEKNELSQIFLLGHSFGGGLAVKLVSKYPQFAKKLFLVSPAIIRKKSKNKELVKKTAKFFSFLPEKIKKIIYHKIIKSDYYQSKLEGKKMKETFLKVINEDVSFSLPEINLPTIIIWGKKDRITPIKEGYLINRKIKNSELKIIQNCAHAPNLECPEKLTEIILSFL